MDPMAGFGRTSTWIFEAVYVGPGLDELSYVSTSLLVLLLYLAIYLDAISKLERAMDRYIGQGHAFFCYFFAFLLN